MKVPFTTRLLCIEQLLASLVSFLPEAGDSSGRLPHSGVRKESRTYCASNEVNDNSTRFDRVAHGTLIRLHSFVRVLRGTCSALTCFLW
jgi:hypothetical protein